MERLFSSEEYDDSIIGMTLDNRLVYSYYEAIDCYFKHNHKESIDDDALYDEAADFISYNARYNDYIENAPILVYESYRCDIDPSLENKLLKDQDDAFVGVSYDEELIYDIDKISNNFNFGDVDEKIVFIKGNL